MKFFENTSSFFEMLEEKKKEIGKKGQNKERHG